MRRAMESPASRSVSGLVKQALAGLLGVSASDRDENPRAQKPHPQTGSDYEQLGTV